MSEEQPASGQDPQTTPDSTVESAAPAPGNGPWAQDLELMFTDPAVRGQVDNFLRAKVQPHTTKLEQQIAASEQARNLWNAFEENPVDAYVAVTTELYGEDAGRAALAAVQQALAENEQPGSPPEQVPPVDPRAEAAIQYVEQMQAQQQYDEQMAAIAVANPDVDPDLLHGFVAAADGDFNQAVEMYRGFLADYATKHGFQPVQQEAPQAPPVMGSDTGSAQPSAAPTEPKAQSLDEAISDFMSEQRASREAPPVGPA